MAHKKPGYKFENDWDVTTLEKDWSNISIAATVPVNIEVKADQKIVHIDNAIKYLEEAEKIYRLDCECRTKRGNCDSPVETCLLWDPESSVESEAYQALNIKEITHDEAYETLRKSNKAGLVHMAYAVGETGKVNSLCSCCSCCCAVFSGLLRFSMFKHVLSSDTIQITDTSKCISCGSCVDVCHFGAREILNEELKVNNDLCYGCGLCVAACPEDAVKIIPKH